jgi:hypothetical protein
MKLRNLLAAGVVALLPTASLAATTGTLDAGMEIPYSCDITFPATSTLTPSGSQATAASAQFSYEQNGDTNYDLSALTITGPAAGMTGVIEFLEGTSVVVANNSTSSGASGTVNGIVASTEGRGTFVLNTTDAAFAAGNYSMGATLSCGQAV